MDLLKLIILSSIALSLVSCGTTQKYAETYSIGQTDISRRGTFASITFSKYPFIRTRVVENYLLYRSALVTIENGYDYFSISSVCSEPCNFNFFNSEYYKQYIYNPSLYTSKFYKSSAFNPFRIKNCCCDTIGYRNPTHPASNVKLIIHMFNAPMPANIHPFNAADIAAHLGPTEAFY